MPAIESIPTAAETVTIFVIRWNEPIVPDNEDDGTVTEVEKPLIDRHWSG